MKNFTTNWALYDPLTPKKKQTENIESEVLSNEIEEKIKLIKRAFRYQNYHYFQSYVCL